MSTRWAVLLCVCLCSHAGLAQAHGFGQRYALPVPLWLYMTGAAAVVACSFAIMVVSARDRSGRYQRPRWHLLVRQTGLLTPTLWRDRRTGTVRGVGACVRPSDARGRLRPFPATASAEGAQLNAPPSRRERGKSATWQITIDRLRGGWRLLSVLMLLLVILTGLWGNQQPMQNLAPTLVWVIWWVGLAYVSILLGNLWAVINPWRTLFVWAERCCRRLRPGRELSWHLPYPQAWGVWPGIVLFLGFAWIELVYDGAAVPAHLAVLALLYTWLTWMGMWLFGVEPWCRHGEAFSLVFALFACCAPRAVWTGQPEGRQMGRLGGEDEGQPWNISTPVSTSEMVLVLVLLATVTFDGLRTTPMWAHIEQMGAGAVPGPGGVSLAVLRTLGLIACPGLFLGLYLVCCWGIGWASGAHYTATNIARVFSVTLVPIAAAYHIAHYLPFLLIQGQYVIPLLSDPFGVGWDVLGTAAYRPHLDLVGAQFAWYTAVIAIVAGHVLAVYLAHRLTRRMWPTVHLARRSQYPMVGVMLGYTMVSLWLLAQPIVEHQDSAFRLAGVPRGRVDVPGEALVPELGSGHMRAVGAGVSAAAQLTYRILTSTFHDGTRMSVADLLYPYIFAYRWGTPLSVDRPAYDPYVDRATALLRQRLVGLRVQRVERSEQRSADFTLLREIPVIEVYVNATEPQYAAVLAPPWSSLPWHLIVLMEAAVERGWAAFSNAAAQRHGVPWLDLVRLPRLQEQWLTLLQDWAQQGYVPEPLQRWVTRAEARQRWTALRTFAQTSGHFLVSNGPYRLSQWSAEAVVLQVWRDPSYPLGIGSYDHYALPHRAYITQVVPGAHGLEVHAEVERVERFMRTHAIVREPLRAPARARQQDDIPQCRYVLLSPDGVVVQTGTAPYTGAGVFRIEPHGVLAPGLYTVLLALYLNKNAVAPEVQTVTYRVPG